MSLRDRGEAASGTSAQQKEPAPPDVPARGQTTTHAQATAWHSRLQIHWDAPTCGNITGRKHDDLTGHFGLYCFRCATCGLVCVGPRLPPVPEQEKVTADQKEPQNAFHYVVSRLVRQVEHPRQPPHASTRMVPADEPQPQPIDEEVRGDPGHRPQTKEVSVGEQTEERDEKLRKAHQQEEFAEREAEERVGRVQGTCRPDGAENLGYSG